LWKKQQLQRRTTLRSKPRHKKRKRDHDVNVLKTVSRTCSTHMNKGNDNDDDMIKLDLPMQSSKAMFWYSDPVPEFFIIGNIIGHNPLERRMLLLVTVLLPHPPTYKITSMTEFSTIHFSTMTSSSTSTSILSSPSHALLLRTFERLKKTIMPVIPPLILFHNLM
jgi:hypothetical protein